MSTQPNSELATKEAQIIPAVDLNGLETALGNLETDAVWFPKLKERADAITITDQITYAEAGALRQEVRSVAKMGEMRLGSFKMIVKRASDFLSGTVKSHQLKAKEIEDSLTKKMNEYIATEVPAARQEQKQMNRGRGEDEQVTVKPNIPAVAGTRKHWVYDATVTDEDALIEQFIAARGESRKYLRKFICVDVDALLQEARDAGEEVEILNKRIKGVEFSRKLVV